MKRKYASAGDTPQDWIARHHKLINDRFYTCPLGVYRGLGNMYVEDPRFAAHYDRIKPGMARFMQAAINAYCDRLESEAARCVQPSFRRPSIDSFTTANYAPPGTRPHSKERNGGHNQE